MKNITKTAMALGTVAFALSACFDTTEPGPIVVQNSYTWDYQCGNQWMEWNFYEGGSTISYKWQGGSIMTPTTRSSEGDTRVVRQDSQTYVISGDGARWIFINEKTNGKTVCNRKVS